MASDELKIVLEDVKEKFDTVIVECRGVASTLLCVVVSRLHY